MSNTQSPREGSAPSVGAEEEGTKVPAPGADEDNTVPPEEPAEYGEVIESLDPDLDDETEAHPT